MTVRKVRRYKRVRNSHAQSDRRCCSVAVKDDFVDAPEVPGLTCLRVLKRYDKHVLHGFVLRCVELNLSPAPLNQLR
jgi:hypothetical protein